MVTVLPTKMSLYVFSILYNESEQSKKQVGKNSCVSKKETFIYSRSLQNLEFSNFDVVFCKG